jgi:hypothetical protein
MQAVLELAVLELRVLSVMIFNCTFPFHMRKR